MRNLQPAQQVTPNDIAGSTLRTLFNIFKQWAINDDQAMQLLGTPRSSYFRWKQNPASARLGKDVLERASYLFGIYKNLQILLPDRQAADSWVNRPNAAPIFHDHPPIERMLAGNVADLYVVRQFLDAVRGGKS